MEMSKNKKVEHMEKLPGSFPIDMNRAALSFAAKQMTLKWVGPRN
jgi:hypothetical protein